MIWAKVQQDMFKVDSFSCGTWQEINWPKMTDNNDGCLRGRGFRYLDKSEGKNMSSLIIIEEKRFFNASVGPKVLLKGVQMDRIVQT